MEVKDIIDIVLIAVTYYLFSNHFFKFSAEVFEQNVSFKKHFIMFLIVYMWFIIASYLELPLAINWIVFLLILEVEIQFVFSLNVLISSALSMFCTIMGLAINIFFRSLISILMNIPLDKFDKAITDAKRYPIFLGFLTMVVIFRMLEHIHFEDKLKLLFQSKKSLIFYVFIETSIYLFLIVQLFIYTQSDNTIGIKLWGIKSAIFSIIILVITNIYSLHVASLHYYMNKQHEMHGHLIQEKRDINKLWKLAYTDVLTSCGNRQLLNKRLQEYAGYGGEITLAFIDVNSLKIINDQYGHVEGDRYLMSVAKVFLEGIASRNLDLFRYGGDEFIMMSNTLTVEEVEVFLDNANRKLTENNNAGYVKSISYGVVHGKSYDYQKLIKEADELMYKYKLEHYNNINCVLNN